MGATFSQFFPPSPTLTEHNLPSQTGKVFIVTGGASGVGLELCRFLYNAGGKVYIAGRSETNALAAIDEIKKGSTQPSGGELHYLNLDLGDLATIRPAVRDFQNREERLDILFCNAGVSNPPKGSVSAQGHELQLATNCLGHYLLAKLLLPTLTATAKIPGPTEGAVRIVWTSSIVVDLAAPKSTPSHPPFELPIKNSNQQLNYTLSKLGNWYLASHFSSTNPSILSVTQNPGNLNTALLRHMPKAFVWFITHVGLLYEAKFGAYTNLYAGFSGELTTGRDGGAYILPWGRKHPAPRRDLVEGLEREAGRFVVWCERAVEGFE